MSFVKKLLKMYELGNGADDAAYEAYIDEFVAPTYAYSDATSTAVVGTAPMKANRRTLRAAMPDLRVSVAADDVVCDVAKRRVAIRWSAEGTFSHDLGPVKATRRSVAYAGTYFAAFDESSRLISGIGAWDLFAFLAQIGVLDLSVNPFRVQPSPPPTPPITVPVQTPPSTPTKRGSSGNSTGAAVVVVVPESFDLALTHLSETRNAWVIVSTEFQVMHSGTAAPDDDPLAVAAALLRDDSVAVLLANCSDARHAKRVARITWCGGNASRAQRTALSHCRLRLDSAVKLFTANFNAFSTEDFDDIRRKIAAF